jgi:hypothetical protein
MRKSTAYLFVISFALLLIVGAMSIYFAWRADQRAAFDRLWQDYLDAGGPASVSEIELAEVPDDENAATLYDRAWGGNETPAAPWDAETSNRIRATLFDNTPHEAEPLTTDEIAELLQRHAGEIELVIEGSRREMCAWNPAMLDVEVHYDVLLPWISPGGSFAEMLCLRAMHAHEAGRTDEVDESLTAALRLADHLAEPPFAIPMLVRAAVQHSVLRTIERLYRAGGEVSDELRAAIEAINPRAGAQQMVLYEGLTAKLSRRQIEDLLEQTAHHVPPDAPWQRPTMAGWHEMRDRSLYLELVLHNAPLMEITPADRTGVLREPTDESWSVLVRRLHLAPSSLDRNLAVAEARQRLAIAAFDLRAHQREHGEYPDPEDWTMPRDPMTRNTMHYQRTDDGGILLQSDVEHRGERFEWRWR